MKIMMGIAGTLVGMMAAGAIAADTTNTKTSTAIPVAKKKVIQKKPISRQAVVTKRQAKQDSLRLPQSSSISAATATTSMPSVTAGTSSMEAPRALKKKTYLDNIRANLQFEYYGSSLADPLTGMHTNKDDGYSESNSPQELYTHVTIGYALSDNLTVSANGYFFSYSDTPDGKGETFGFRPADSYLKLGVGKFYQSGRFKWNGDFRVYPGVGTAYPGRIAYLRSGQNFTYSVTPRLTLAAYNTIRYYHNNDSAYAREEKKDLDGNKVDAIVTYGPAIEYQLLDSTGLSLSFNDAIAHTHQNNTISDAGYYKGSDWNSYFEFGASIDFTKAINFNPYVDMFPHTFNVEAMQLGANLNFTIL